MFFAPHPDLKDAVCSKLSEKAREIFYSSSGNGYKKALKFCRACPVQKRCLEIAMDFEQGLDIGDRFGVWGGKTAADRARLAGGVDEELRSA